jgi:hypothetical protein
MSYPARALVAGLACFVIWTMIRALRSGTLFSDGGTFTADEQPVMFSLGVAAHSLCVAYLLWLAAGYDSHGFFRLIGLDFD